MVSHFFNLDKAEINSDIQAIRPLLHDSDFY